MRAVALAAVAWVCIGTGVAYAVFTNSTSNTSTFVAASSFNTYPAQILSNGPLFYHKEEEGRANSTGSAAADASTNARGGLYKGRTDGPSLWFKFEEGSGTTVADASGNGVSGTASGTTWTSNASAATSGYAGNALIFNGTSSYTATTRTPVPSNASFTVSAWVYPTWSTNVTRTVLAQNGTASSPYILKWTTDGSGTTTGHWDFLLIGQDANGPSSFAGSRGPTITQPLNTWTHLVAVVDAAGSATKLYVNGVDSNTGGGSASTYTAPFNATGAFQVGRTLYASTQVDFWQGTIDDVRVWARAFNATDALNLYNGLGDPPVTTWGFDDMTGTGSTTTDYSGTGNSGTPSGITFTPAKIDRSALLWPGVTSSAVVGSKAALRTDQNFSVAAWVKPTAKNATVQAAVAQSGSSSFAFELNYRTDVNNGASTKFAFSMTNSDTNGPSFTILQGTTVPTLNTWYHLAGTYNATSRLMTLYVNGTQEGTATLGATMWNATGYLTAGRGLWNGALADPWYGAIDDIRAYQRILPASEVSALAASTQSYALSSAQQTGALQGAQQLQTATKAVAYSGIGGGYNNTSFVNPTAATLECWFRTNNASGGILLEFGDVVSTVPGSYDRVLYLDSTGKLTFGIYNGGPQSIQSPATYTDGAWHHVAATLSSTAGLALYVDGAVVASNAAYTTPQNYSGYFRWASGNLDLWPNRPLSDSFIGLLDEIAVYGRALSSQEVAWDYYANH